MNKNEDENGALNTPRDTLPLGWLDLGDFTDFDEFERTYAHQIEQNLAALPLDKAAMVLNFIANSARYGLNCNSRQCRDAP